MRQTIARVLSGGRTWLHCTRYRNIVSWRSTSCDNITGSYHTCCSKNCFSSTPAQCEIWRAQSLNGQLTSYILCTRTSQWVSRQIGCDVAGFACDRRFDWKCSFLEYPFSFHCWSNGRFAYVHLFTAQGPPSLLRSQPFCEWISHDLLGGQKVQSASTVVTSLPRRHNLYLLRPAVNLRCRATEVGIMTERESAPGVRKTG